MTADRRRLLFAIIARRWFGNPALLHDVSCMEMHDIGWLLSSLVSSTVAPGLHALPTICSGMGFWLVPPTPSAAQEVHQAVPWNCQKLEKLCHLETLHQPGLPMRMSNSGDVLSSWAQMQR